VDHLTRELAPIGPRAWQQIDETARRTLNRTLAGRQLVDFTGPRGWEFSSVGLGRTRPIRQTVKGVNAQLRLTQALVEYTVPFTLARSELDAITRGAEDADLENVVQAARAAALAEDRAIFEGFEEAGIHGILERGRAQVLTLSDDYDKYPGVVASALTWLRQQGIDGPYAIALGPRCFQGLTETTNEGGYPVINLVRQQLDGRIVWAPAIDGAVVLSTRGGDFELVVGQDFAVGYARDDGPNVELYLQESITFRVLTPDAAVPLRYASRNEAG
jgi:uncharacterized linocin/CFP29 family protein